MIHEWLWGDIPAGFKKILPGRNRIALVREGQVGCLDLKKIVAQREMAGQPSPFQGRGKLRLLRLASGETALVRSYRHGGIFRHLTGDLFFTWPPRPFKELAITAEANRRNVPTLEVLAALVERVGGPIYRGWLVTRELKGAQDLWEALQGIPCSENGRTPLLRAVALSIRRMHQQGIYHGDLNLKNIMVRREGSQITSYIIDFDKAKLFSRELPVPRARRNLRRFLRSACKLDPERKCFSQEAWDLFIDFYREATAG